MIRRHVESCLNRALEAVGLELWGYEWAHGALRVCIEHPSGITIEQCERASRQIKSVLDVEQLLQGCQLEVSSPGIERRLFQFEQCCSYVGKLLRLRLKQLRDGRKSFTGVLKSAESRNLHVQVDNEALIFPFDEIDKVHLFGLST